MAITVGTDGWCTAAQVRAVLKQFDALISAGTGLITDTLVEGRITGRFHRIQAATRNRGYANADILTDAAALGYCQEMNTVGAVADTLKMIQAGGTASLGDFITDYQAQFDAMLEDITRGRVDLGELDNDVEAGPTVTTTLRTGGTYETPPLTKARVF